jgi:hypothetical protein
VRKTLVLVLVVLLPALGSAQKTPPPKEWQPLIDGSTGAIKKKDAAALAKHLASWLEFGTACATKAPTAKDLAQAEDMDKQRPDDAARSIRDCSHMDWTKAKFVSAEGGELEPPTCAKLQFAKAIVLHYTEGTDDWRVTLPSPVILKGKRLLVRAPVCQVFPRK